MYIFICRLSVLSQNIIYKSCLGYFFSPNAVSVAILFIRYCLYHILFLVTFFVGFNNLYFRNLMFSEIMQYFGSSEIYKDVLIDVTLLLILDTTCLFSFSIHLFNLLYIGNNFLNLCFTFPAMI